MSKRARVNSNVACGCWPTAVLSVQPALIQSVLNSKIPRYQEVDIPGDLYIADKGQNKDGTAVVM